MHGDFIVKLTTTQLKEIIKEEEMSTMAKAYEQKRQALYRLE